MTAELDELYFTWLTDQVEHIKSKDVSKTYLSLLRDLFNTEFQWSVPHDDNRAEDGYDLRDEFISESDLEVDPEWESLGCSMLELIISLARGLSFVAEGESAGWFWELLHNADLLVTDGLYDHKHTKEVLDRIIFRKYERDGMGGFFPLHDPKEDQREVELWYQLNTYVLDQT